MSTCDDLLPSAISTTESAVASVDSTGNESLNAEEHTLWLGETVEFWNTLTHGMACLASLIAVTLCLTWYRAGDPYLMSGFAAYGFSLITVFLCSTLSHAVREPRRRNKWRAWDQGAIYLLIAGTYTPFAVRFLDGQRLAIVLIGIWCAAAFGFYSKVFAKHRVNALATVTYLLLGWLPALPFANRVPIEVVAWMAGGGVLYTLGVVFLKYDVRVRFFHAIWHLFVVGAGAVHFTGIILYTQSYPS